MDKRCGNCKHWERFKRYSRTGECLAPIPHGVSLYIRETFPVWPTKQKDGQDCPTYEARDAQG
jgi:hypothetical protein